MISNHKSCSRVDDIDRYVGNQIKTRRLMLGLSQESIGKVLNVSIQQIQKYERGTNRISGANLYRVSKFLNVPISDFFIEVENNIPGERQAIFLRPDFHPMTTEREVINLVKIYHNISCPQVRKKLCDLMTSLSAIP